MTEIDLGKEVEIRTRSSAPMLGDFVLWLLEPKEKFAAVFGPGPDREKIEHAQVTLTINGVELDMLPAFKRLGEIWDATVRSAAEGLIHEKFGALEDALRQLKQDLGDEVRKKLGLEPWEDD